MSKKKSTSAAGKVLRDKSSSADEKSAAASVLGKSRDTTTIAEAISLSPIAELIKLNTAMIEFVKAGGSGIDGFLVEIEGILERLGK